MSKDGYNINEPPVGNILPKMPPKAPPKAPPTTEYVGGRVCKGDVRLGSGCGACSRCFAQVKELSLLPSERKEFLSKIKELNNKYEMAYANALRSFTRVINTHEGLTSELKESILYRIWNE